MKAGLCKNKKLVKIFGIGVLLVIVLPVFLNYFGDSVLHQAAYFNRASVEAENIREIQSKVRHLDVTVLPSVLRRSVWFNVFDFSEVNARIPNLIYFTTSVVLVFLCSFAMFKERAMSSWLALPAALLSALYLAFVEPVRDLALEPRYFAFMLFCSIFWFFSYLRLGQGKRELIVFSFSSFLLLNLHLIGVYLATSVILVEVIRSIVVKDYLSLKVLVTSFILSVVVAVFLNSSIIIHSMESDLSSSEKVQGFAIGVHEVSSFLKSLGKVVGVPLWASVLAVLVLLVSVFYPKDKLRASSLKCIYVSLLVCPLAYFAYFTNGDVKAYDLFIFLGPFLGILTLGFGNFFSIYLEYVNKRDAVFLSLCTLTLVSYFSYSSFIEPTRAYSLSLGNTEARKFFSALKRAKKKVFLVSRPCYMQEMTKFHWRSLGRDYERDITFYKASEGVSCSKIWQDESKLNKEQLDSFFEAKDEGLFVFELTKSWKHFDKASNENMPAGVELSKQSINYLRYIVLEGVSSSDELIEVSRKLKILH